MSMALQIGLGLIPVVLAMILIIILRKCYTAKNIIVALGVTSLVTMLIITGTPLGEKTLISEMSKDEMMDLAYALAEEEAWGPLDEIISEYSLSYGYDEACTLLYARAEAIKGNIDKAIASYKKYLGINKNDKDVQNEFSATERAFTSKTNDPVMINAMKEAGKNPADYGFDTDVNTNTDAISDMVSAAKSGVKKECKKRKIDKETKEVAELVKKTDALYTSFLTGENETAFESENQQQTITDSANSLVKEYKKLNKDYPQALSVYPIRMARLKACVLSEDYSSIAELLDEYASYDEIMIATELYMNGYVSKSDFADSWSKIDDKKYNSVVKQLRSNAKSGSLNEDEQEKAIKTAEIIEDISGDGVLEIAKAHLNAKLESDFTDVDKSKIYLHNSKIDRFLGNEESSVENMLLAIDTAADSKDDNYSYPMCEIAGIINGSSDIQKVMNVAEYVDQVVDNSLTIRPHEDIHIQKEEIIENDEVKEKEDDEKIDSFADYMEEKVSYSRAAVNVGTIDHSNFTNIKAKVQLSSELVDESNPESYVNIYDCMQKIENFDLEKMKYSQANIMLVCDNSGSMSGSIDELQDAVTEFINTSNDKEKISIITFDSSVLEEIGFDSTDSDRRAIVDGMRDRGGTDIYNTIIYGINKFPYNTDANNVMIVMTDGEDGRSSTTLEQLEIDIGIPANDKGITIYTLGMGSGVKADYLSNIASVGGGDFVYASEKDRLSGLYDVIHGQSKNQYLLTYDALDTLTLNNRELKIEIKGKSLSDSKLYSLGDEDSENNDNLVKVMKDIYISGFDTRIIKKGKSNTLVNFKGSGFKEEYDISLTLDGVVDYTLSPKFIDENTYEVEIPYGVAVDVYNLRVSIDKHSMVLPEELYVVDEKKSITFGGYTFNANKIVQTDSNTHVLQGMVDLNGWLNFKGDIILSGDIKNGYSITMKDESGSNIIIDPTLATGLSKYLANKGRSISIAPMHSVTLYNDKDHIKNFEEYEVAHHRNLLVNIINRLKFEQTDFMLYPDRLKVQNANVTTFLPLQDALIKTSTGGDLLKMKVDKAITFSSSGIHAFFEFENSNDGKYKGAQLGKLPVSVNLSKFTLDTAKSILSFELETEFTGLKDVAVSLELGWKDMSFDKIMLCVDTDVNTNISGVPVTFSKFSGGLEDLALDEGENGKERLLNSVFKAGTKISAVKLSSFGSNTAKNLLKYIGDISLLSTDNLELSFSLGQRFISAKTDILFLEEIKCMQIGLEIGHFSYTNTMLGFEDVATTGIRGSVKQGIMYDKLDTFELDLSFEGELNLHDKFFGYKGDATGKAILDLWIIRGKIDISGEFALGFRKEHSGNYQFVVGVMGHDNKKTWGRLYYIGSNGLDHQEL